MNSRLKVILPVTLVAVLVAAGLIVLHIGQNSTHATSKHVSASPSNAPTASQTKAAAAISAVDEYPPSRFQSGRPSGVFGVTAAASDNLKKTVTLKWEPNPATQNVDEYAVYYHSFVAAPPSRSGAGVLAAVTKATSLTLTIIQQDPNDGGSSPYGQAQIPICVDQSDCVNTPFDTQAPYQIEVWVLAHNKFGWSDNDPRAANPDENPNFFSELSDNQSLLINATAGSWQGGGSIDLSTVNPKFTDGSWPQPANTPYSGSTIASPLDNTPWTIPWLPNVELPTTRFGPGRPSDIKNLKASIDFINGTINISWDPSPADEKVDSYAIYASYHRNVDDGWFTNSQIISTQTSTNFSSYINIDGLSSKSSQDKSGTSTFFIDQPYSAEVWVIAHNKNGWGNNDPETANPDQSAGDFRSLSKQELSEYHPPADVLGIGLPCKLSDAKANNCLVDPQNTYSY